ncbi:MAG: T9SS type A sorting domain-containing protein [Bacteroidia bacterium]
MLRFNFIAPQEIGFYSSTFSDNNGIYSDIVIQLEVTDSPLADTLINLPATVNEIFEAPDLADATALFGIGCVDEFYGGDNQSIQYEWFSGSAPVICTTTPDELILDNNAQQIVTNSALFNEVGSFTIYRATKHEFRSFPIYVKVNFIVSEINNVLSINNSNKIIPFPNPTDEFLNIFNAENATLRRMDGKIINAPVLNSDSGTQIDMRNLEKGIYLIECGNVFYRVLKK